MNRRLLIRVLLSSIILTGGLSYAEDAQQEGTAMQTLFGKTLGDTSNLKAEIDNRGDDWKSTKKDFNILDGDYAGTNEQLAEVDNNVYYLSGLVEGVPGTKSGGLLKQVSDVDDEIDGYAKRITDVENKAKDLTTDISNKADTSYVNTELAKKSTPADITESISTAVATGGVVDQAISSKTVNIIDTQISSGGSIFEAIGKAAEAGGGISQDIAKQVTDKEGPVYDAIIDGSENTINTSLETGGAIKTELDKKASASDFKTIKDKVDDATTGLDSKAAKSDLDVYTKTEDFTPVKTQAAANETDISNLKTNKADVNALDNYTATSALPGVITSTMSAGSGSTIIKNYAGDIVTNSIASGGTIYEAITSDDGVISEAINTQISSGSGAIYDAIVSGSSVAIDDSVASGAIKTELDKKANASDLDSYTKTEDFTPVKTQAAANETDISNLKTNKADVSALDNYTATSALPGVITSTMSAGSGSTIIKNYAGDIVTNSIASGGTIYEAITSDDGVISEAINIQVSSGSGAIYDAIVSGSSVVIDDSVASGAIKTELDKKANADDFKTIKDKVNDATTGLDSKAAKSDLDEYSKTTDLNDKFDAKADLTAFNSLRNTVLDSGSGLATKANQSDFVELQSTVMDSGSGLATKADDARVEELLTEAISAPSELDQDSDGATSVQGLIYNAVADATGDLALAIQKNIEDSQSGAVAQAIDTKISQATDTGIIKTALDDKAPRAEFETVKTAVNDANTGLSAINTKVTTNETNLGTLEGKVDDNTTGLNTKLDSAQTKASIAESLTVAVDKEGTIFDAVTLETGKIAAEIKEQVDAEAGAIFGAIKSGADKAIDKSLASGGKIRQEIDGIVGSSVPVGTIVMWGQGNIPDGWLELDGQAISTETYPDLVAIYGANLPDFRGYFPRAAGTNSDGTSSANLLQKQGDQLARHTHGAGNLKGYYRGRLNDDGGSGSKGAEMYNYSSFDTSSTNGSVRMSGNTAPYGGNETRPKNIAVRFIIKAK